MVLLVFIFYVGMDIGCDNGLVVDCGYEDKVFYVFIGIVIEVIFDFKFVYFEVVRVLYEYVLV